MPSPKTGLFSEIKSRKVVRTAAAYLDARVGERIRRIVDLLIDGRPTLVRLTKDDLDKQFGRKG